MKKICAIFMLALLAIINLNCGQAPPPPNAFRLKTRVKFRLFGVIPLFGIPAPFQQINLKTNTTAGAPGTVGTKGEFDLNGAYTMTDHVGKKDALDAILPATWTVKVNPNQPIEYPCAYPATMSFQAQSGQTYKYKCSIDLVNNFQTAPDGVYIDQNGMPDVGMNPINWGTKTHPYDFRPVFANAQNLTVQYYRLTGIDTTNGDHEEIYELESSGVPSNVKPDGTEVTTPFPPGWRTRSGFLVSNVMKIYHIVLIEDGVYIGHTQFTVEFAEQTCGRTRVC